MSHFRLTILSVCVVAGVLVGAWFVTEDSKMLDVKTTEEPASVSHTRVVSPRALPQLPAYRNSDYRFEFTYPAGWTVISVTIPPQPDYLFLAVTLRPTSSGNGDTHIIQIAIEKSGASFIPDDVSPSPTRRVVAGQQALEIAGEDSIVGDEMLTTMWINKLDGRNYIVTARWDSTHPDPQSIIEAYNLVLKSFVYF